MADAAYEASCHACQWYYNNGDPQCRLKPHDFQTATQRAIVKWLGGPYGHCPGFEPDASCLSDKP